VADVVVVIQRVQVHFNLAGPAGVASPRWEYTAGVHGEAGWFWAVGDDPRTAYQRFRDTFGPIPEPHIILARWDGAEVLFGSHHEAGWAEVQTLTRIRELGLVAPPADSCQGCGG